MSSSRADAPARRSCIPICGVDRLPKVPWSNGVEVGVAHHERIDSTGARSSSATCCVSDVRIPCPNSTLPV